MKIIGSTLAALLVASTLPSFTDAFAVGLSPQYTLSTSFRAPSAFVPRTLSKPSSRTTPSSSHCHSSSPSMSYTVAIVGATGAVGKEIRQCLEASSFPTSTLRIFGSARSAGTTIVSDSFGSITVELFDVAKARDCDVVFLAVSGDFSLEHAEAISEGVHGAVVIDNSVRSLPFMED
jgi:Semialdehyde dehydrogenase, NAD binding domain